MPRSLACARTGQPNRGAVEVDLALIEFEAARKRLDESRFACAVVADQPDHLAGLDVEVGAVERADVAEAPRDAPRLQQCGHELPSVLSVGSVARWCRACRRAARTSPSTRQAAAGRGDDERLPGGDVERRCRAWRRPLPNRPAPRRRRSRRGRRRPPSTAPCGSNGAASAGNTATSSARRGPGVPDQPRRVGQRRGVDDRQRGVTVEPEEHLRVRGGRCWCAPTGLTDRSAPGPRSGGCLRRSRAGCRRVPGRRRRDARGSGA